MSEKKTNLKFVPGGRTCAGCAIPLIVNNVLSGTDFPVAAIATSCLEVTSTLYPYNSWNVPCIHNAFENVASTIAGVETAFKYKQKKGTLTEDEKKTKFVAFAGDGGAYDIGFQAISGAFERGHDFTLVVYDNEGYQNTGGQRSAATPLGANTTTTPVGKESQGKPEWRKNLTEILVAHKSPYVAQASIHNLADLQQKAKKALSTKGPTALIILSPCTTIWGFPPAKTIEMSKLATETNFWPLYEVENGKYTINVKHQEPKPVEEFLKGQKRFSHILNSPEKIAEIQKWVDKEWKELLKKEEN
jgi:pyruvate ferredoxin oxidoreductase beta subunit